MMVEDLVTAIWLFTLWDLCQVDFLGVSVLVGILEAVLEAIPLLPS